MGSSESRYRNHKDSQIAALSKRLRMENEVSQATEQTKNSLRDESRRWQVKYEQLALEHETYKRRIEEG